MLEEVIHDVSEERLANIGLYLVEKALALQGNTPKAKKQEWGQILGAGTDRRERSQIAILLFLVVV